ncbi:MAG: ABC transporter permease [Mycobacterium sp.]
MFLTFGRRLAGAVPVLLTLVLAVFVLQKVSPVDPVAAYVGGKATPEVYEAARQQLGLDKPLPVQFLDYLGRALRGDLGESTVTRTPVAADIGRFLPVTLELMAVAVVIMVALGFLMGLATAARWRGSGVLRVLMMSGASLPVYLACLLAMLVFYRWLGVLPVAGQTAFYDPPTGPTGFLLIDSLLAGRLDVFFDDLRHLVLPAFCVALAPAAAIGRVLRSSLETTMAADHTRTARVKGLGEKSILFRHCLRNSLSPVLALMGLQLAGLVGSSILVEMIFARPGIGAYFAQAITKGDFNTIAGVTMVVGVMYVVANLMVDVVQAVADPRVSV